MFDTSKLESISNLPKIHADACAQYAEMKINI